MSTRVINKDAAHHLRSDSQELCPVLPLCFVLIYKEQISFIDQSGRLQSVIDTLSPQVSTCQSTQLSVNKRH
jgi:hypothetical protein